MTHRVRIDVCGRFAVTVDGQRRDQDLFRQGRLLLAFLAIERERPVSRDEAASAVWGEQASGPRNAGMSTLLSRLRRSLGPGVIESPSRTSLQLVAEAGVDYHDTTRWLAHARSALEQGLADEALRTAEDAMRMADQGLLPGESAPWLDLRRRSARRLRGASGAPSRRARRGTRTVAARPARRTALPAAGERGATRPRSRA